jgi:MoxR-like ATPase
MTTYMKAHDGLYLVASSDNNNGTVPLMELCHGRIYLVDQVPQGAEIDIQAVVADLIALRDEIGSQLLNMTEPLDVVMTALITGYNVYLLSLPGAAKSTLARLLARGIGGDFFRINLNPDISRSDLLGPVDPDALRRGEWQRKLAGLAKCNIALVDEWDKGSSVVHNMLLSAFEEHIVPSPNGEIPIPLLLGISAANALVDPNPRNAAWDRFLFRVEVNYPNAKQYNELIGAGSGRVPIKIRISPAHIILGQAWVEYRAMDLDKSLKATLQKAVNALAKKGFVYSPRRFIGWAAASVAANLINGNDADDPAGMLVGTHILWFDPQEIPEVTKVVSGLADPERGVMMEVAADIEHAREQLTGLAGLDNKFEVAAKLTVRLKQAQNKLEARVVSAGNRSDKDEMLNAIQELRTELLEASAA